MDEQTAENRIRLALADDQVLFRASLGRFLATQPGFELAGECGTAAEVLELLNASAADIVLSDLDLLTERGDDLISAARSAGYKGRFLIVAGAADARELSAAIKLGPSEALKFRVVRSRASSQFSAGVARCRPIPPVNVWLCCVASTSDKPAVTEPVQ